MRYEIEADWHLLNTCNYRCDYCFSSAETLGEKLRIFATPQEWRSAFDATGKLWLLHLSGGEPSIYPDFCELCRVLTEQHRVSINSNLTGSSLPEFAEDVDPSRVSFINASLHLEEREARSGHAKFLRNADLLRCKGFPVLVSLVATPMALARFEEAVALLNPIDLFPIPKLLHERFEGRLYPDAYTELDKIQFRLFSMQARKFYDPVLARMAERPSIDMFSDDAYLGGVPDFTGIPCDAGYRFASIKPNGDAFRCGPGWHLGNILQRTFALRPDTAPCNSRHCFYFCRKYAGHKLESTLNPARTLSITAG